LEGQVAPQNSFVFLPLVDSNPIRSTTFVWVILTSLLSGNLPLKPIAMVVNCGNHSFVSPPRSNPFNLNGGKGNNAYVGTALAMSIAFAEAVPVIYK
jgi:hypothetical protein